MTLDRVARTAADAWTLPGRALRRCVLIGQYIRYGEARSALASTRTP